MGVDRTMPAVVAAAFAGVVVLGGCDQMKKGLQDAIRDSTASQIDALPRDSIIGELRADFPQDYARLRVEGAQATATHGPAAAEEVGRTFMRLFYSEHVADLD